MYRCGIKKPREAWWREEGLYGKSSYFPFDFAVNKTALKNKKFINLKREKNVFNNLKPLTLND